MFYLIDRIFNYLNNFNSYDNKIYLIKNKYSNGWSELPRYAIDCINYLNLRNKITILTDNKKARNLIKYSRVKIISLNKNYTWESISF